MIIREIRTFVSSNNIKIEEYVAVHASTGTPASASEIAYATNKMDIKEYPQSVFCGVKIVPGAVVNEQGKFIGVSPQEIRFQIDATNRIEAISGFEKGFEGFMRNMEERERLRQKGTEP